MLDRSRRPPTTEGRDHRPAVRRVTPALVRTPPVAFPTVGSITVVVRKRIPPEDARTAAGGTAADRPHLLPAPALPARPSLLARTRDHPAAGFGVARPSRRPGQRRAGRPAAPGPHRLRERTA